VTIYQGFSEHRSLTTAGQPQGSAKNVNALDISLTVITGGLALILYTRTLTPGLLPGDSGEFQTLAYLWGHTHPTGYPVYLTLAKLMTLVPVGDIAYRVNLFSTLMAVLAVAGVYWVGRLLTGYRLVAAAGALALAISPTFWSQAIIAEVYTAGAAWVVFILLALLWWDGFNRPRALFLAGLLGGLSLGVHMSVALLAPAALVFVVAALVPRRTATAVTTNVKAALIGAVSGVLLTVLIFWLIDWNNPPANYFTSVIEPSRSAWEMEAAGIDGPGERLIFGWSARQFRPFMFADITQVMPEQAGNYWRNLPGEFSRPFIVLVVVGVIGLLARRPRAAALLLLAMAAQLFYFFNYSIWDLYVFYIPSYILLALLAIGGTGAIIDLAYFMLGNMTRPPHTGRILLDAVAAVLVFVVAVWPTFQPQQEAVMAGENPFDFDEYPIYQENLRLMAAATVADLPQNAIVFTDWGMMWPYYHVAHVEDARLDLTFVETFPRDDTGGLADSVLDYLEANLPEHPIYFSEQLPAVKEAGYIFSPERVGPITLYKLTSSRRDTGG